MWGRDFPNVLQLRPSMYIRISEKVPTIPFSLLEEPTSAVHSHKTINYHTACYNKEFKSSHQLKFNTEGYVPQGSGIIVHI